MINFTRALYTDLLTRIQKMIVRIDNGNHHEDIKYDFVHETMESLKELETRVSNVISSGDLEINFFLANNLSNYSKFNQDLGYLELYRIQPINNYGRGDHFFKVVVEKIYDDSNILSSPPLISTISNSDNYYWAVPYENIIAVPFWEEESLINLPDLYHEIGHLIFEQYYGALTSRFMQEIEDHFRLEMSIAQDENRDSDFKRLESSEQYWIDSWYEEFVCDLIATYLTGPAFAWTNMKLTTISHSKAQVYHYYKSHPADEARTRAIIKMLKLIGNTDESESILDAWNSFEQLINYPKIPSYDIIFSDELLEKLTLEIYGFCRDIDLNVYSAAYEEKKKSIAHYLNEAWDVSRNNSSDFSTWEKNTIVDLNQILGV